MSSEEGIAKAKEVLPESMVTGLGSANWKERLAATEELSTFVESLPDTPDFNVDAICHLLQSCTKAWKESNFQVTIALCINIYL
jgi:cytoskeleton-associated protein 5